MPKKYAIFLSNSQPPFKQNNPGVRFVTVTFSTSSELSRPHSTENEEIDESINLQHGLHTGLHELTAFSFVLF